MARDWADFHETVPRHCPKCGFTGRLKRSHRYCPQCRARLPKRTREYDRAASMKLEEGAE